MVKDRESHELPCDNDHCETSSQQDGESFPGEDPSSETSDQVPDKTPRDDALGQHATSVNSPQRTLTHTTLHDGSSSSAPVSDAQPDIVLRSTVSLKELTPAFLDGRVTHTNHRWVLKPISESDSTRDIPDGFTPFTPV